MESANFSLYVPHTVVGSDLVFSAIGVSQELLAQDLAWPDSGFGVEHLTGHVPVVRQLQPVVFPTAGGPTGSHYSGWRTPSIVSVVLGSVALCGVFVLAGICLCAGRTSTAALASHV